MSVHDQEDHTASPATGGFDHHALIYGSDLEYVRAVVPFIRDGLDAGESVSVVTTAPNLSLLQTALGLASRAVDFTEHDETDLTPARKIDLLHRACDGLVAGYSPRARVVGDARFGTTTSEQIDWVRYEAILNDVFAAVPQTFLCAYDSRAMPDWLLQTAWRTHPHVREGGHHTASPEYESPAALAREYSRLLAPPPPDEQTPPDVDVQVDRGALTTVRGLLATLAQEASGSGERASAITVGLNEVITNALKHGSDRAHVRCWRAADRLVCEVTDDGPGLDDPLAGYRPPEPTQLEGRGLWLARQTLDTVELQTRYPAGLRAHLTVRT